MSAMPAHPLATSRLMLKLLLTAVGMLMAFAAVSYQKPMPPGTERTVVDFHAFYVAGALGQQGRAADSYDAARMERAEKEMTGVKVFMPWTYPPPFTLFVTALAALPIGWAYALFTGLSLAGYVAVLHRIAGAHLPGVVLAILPLIVLTVIVGQNGFLTGALTGWFLLALIARRPGAGVPLGLMVIKPHLAAGLALVTLVERRVQVVIVAALVVAAALLVPTLVFGPSIWTAFIGGVRESGAFLSRGTYPMFRMTSLYAMALSLGTGPGIAFAVQAMGAVAAMGLLLLAWYRALPLRLLAACACAATLFVSPYAYDYDLALLGVGLAFILPDLLQRMRGAEQVAMLALLWFGTGYGLVMSFLRDADQKGLAAQPDSLMAPALIVLIGWAVLVMRRRPLTRSGSAAAAPGAADPMAGAGQASISPAL
jgi:multidrug transporter EmrE-like cation transporter